LSFRRFLLVRVGWALLALWLALTVFFVITRVISLRAEDFRVAPGRVLAYEAFARELRLDDPIHERYARFLRDTARQDFGRSLMTGRGSRAIAVQALPATLSLVLPGLGLALLFGSVAAIPLRRAPPRGRYLWRIPVAVAVGIPPMLLGLWLSYVSFKSGRLPIAGYCDFFNPPTGSGCGGAVDWAEHLVLPWLTIGLFFAAIYARVLRVWLRDLAAASDESRPRLARRARCATARLVGRDLGFAIGVAVFVESAFSIPGLARVLVVSVSSYDFRPAEAAAFYACILAIGVHLLVDVVVGALDADLRAEWPVAGMPVRT
jgi:peptide/nickel transport system permease protein